eukprot:SAG11_NODE_601_length_8254_cov_12.333047_8_plen_90_part_00
MADMHGCHLNTDVAGIASELEDKTKSEVEKYSIVFWEKGPETLGDWDKYVARIEEGERKIERLKDMILAFELKCNEVRTVNLLGISGLL